jgi:hypothetical protein
MKKIIFIAKTNLNNDGRILNQIKILQNVFPGIYIDFILLPDTPLLINLGENVRLHNIDLSIRHNKFLRLFTTIEFTMKALVLLFKLKAQVIHTQDLEVVLPVWIYRLIRGKSFTLIYDDHEIPNENESIQERIYTFFETNLMKIADYVIFANEERMQILKNKYKLKNNCSYMLNLPYFEEEGLGGVNDTEIEKQLEKLDDLSARGIKFIIHQGPLAIVRGRMDIAAFAEKLPDNFKILLLGGSKNDYEKFISEFNLSKDCFYFIGSVNYLALSKFWNRGIASIVIYLPTYINNRLCAPNRFYLSLKKCLPAIVNKDNPVLSNFINKYKCGFFIDEILTPADFMRIINWDRENLNFAFNNIQNEQVDNFVSIYRDKVI